MSNVFSSSSAISARNLPVVLGNRQERRQFHRASVKSDFASQLIAAREQVPAQRARRRASETDVVYAYDRSAKLGERRLPQGYRLSLSV